jgi:hypothetical protein
MPVGTANLVSGQEQYTFDDNWLEVLRVEAADAAGNFYPLKPFDFTDLAEGYTEFQKLSGNPGFVDVVGNTLTIKPASNYSAAASLKVFFSRKPSYFLTSDTTKQPGFAAPFHKILTYGPAAEYCDENDIEPKATKYQKKADTLIVALLNHLGRRNNILDKPILKPARRLSK